MQDALQVLLQMKHDCPPLRMKSLCWDRRISRESGKELKEFRAARGGGGLKRTQAHKSELAGLNVMGQSAYYLNAMARELEEQEVSPEILNPEMGPELIVIWGSFNDVSTPSKSPGRV